MYELRVCLFGQFQLWSPDSDLDGLDARKARELFCYLLLHRVRPHAREVLADLISEDCPAAQARKFLRQALWQLQRICGPDEGGESILLVGDDSLQINPAANLWVDVAAFEGYYEQVREVPDALVDQPQVDAMRAAVNLYLGDLLEGWYQDWCLFERERLQNMYLVLLDRLMTYCERHCKYQEGLAYGERVLRCDPARERTHQRLMQFYYYSGDRTAALRQFARCQAALHDELDVEPSRRTLALREQISADRLSGPCHQAEEPVESAAPVAAPELLAQLRHIQHLLNRLQRQLVLSGPVPAASRSASHIANHAAGRKFVAH